MSFGVGQEVVFEHYGRQIDGRVARTAREGFYLVLTTTGTYRVKEDQIHEPDQLLHVTMTREAAEKAIEALHAGSARLGYERDDHNWLLWLVGRIEAAKRDPDGVSHA